MAFVRSVISGNLLSLMAGCTFGWSTTSLPQLRYSDSPVSVTDAEITWIASLNVPGGIIGCIGLYMVKNWVGRKHLMLYSTVPYFTGWWLLFFSSNATMIMISEIVLGIGLGMTLPTIPTYLSEISKTEHRGLLIGTYSISFCAGKIVINTLGIFLSIRQNTLAMVYLTCMTALGLLWAVESPYYLILRDKTEKAERCLLKLRRATDVQEELNSITKIVKNDLSTQTPGFFILFTNPMNRKILLLLCGQLVLITCSGAYAIPVYAGIVFTSLVGDTYGRYINFAVGVSELIGDVVTASLIDVIGRKRIFMAAMSGASVFTLITGTYFYLKANEYDMKPFVYVPAEMFPTSVKTQGVVVEECFGFLSIVIVSKVFGVVVNAIGLYVPFSTFSVLWIATAIYTVFLIPETANKSFSEIQCTFQQ